MPSRLLVHSCLFLASSVCCTRFAVAQAIAPQAVAPVIQAATGEEKSDLTLWADFLKQADRQGKNPRGITDLYLQFLRTGAKSSPALNPSIAINIWDLTIDLVDRRVNAPKAALALCDEALALYGTHPRAAVLLAGKMRVLVYEGRNAEAQAYTEANWEQAAEAPAAQARRILWYYCLALQAQDKRAEIPTALGKMMLQNSLLLDEEYQTTNGWMYRYLVNGLIEQGKTKEALSWAKLRWMECAFDDQKIQGASSLLAQVWKAQSGDNNAPKELGRFITAQQNALPAPTTGVRVEAMPSANPLLLVPTPPIEPQGLQRQLVRLSSQAGEPLHEQKTRGRINLLILAEAWGRAMTEAQQLLGEPATSLRGIKEIARVYKARDLSLVRANDFLDWVETKQGLNPLDRFFRENPVQKTPIGIGGAT